MHKILLAFFLLFSVGLWGQTEAEALINIDKKDVRLKQIIKAISNQSGLDFSFNAKTIDSRQIISFSAKGLTVEEALTLLSEKIGASFNIVENQIILFVPTSSEVIETEKYYSISGFLLDKSTGESLIGATVAVIGTSIGAVTNAFGYYSLQLPKGKHILAFSYVGYQLQRQEMVLNQDVKKDLELAPSSIDLPGVLVAIPLKNRLEKKEIGRMEFRPKDLDNMPEFGGESGLVKGLQSLPGIKMHSDGSAFFFTRGGERDQNLIIIDDAPIYNPSHLFGFYSIVVPDFAKSIQIYKSNIPANLGDRLSSIINIRTRDGNLNKWEFSGALNPLINRFSVEGPIVKKKSALFLSFRRSNFEWLYRRPAPNARLSFGDFNFKYNQKFNDKNRLFLTIISSGDEFTNNVNSGSGINWGNFASTLRWNHIFGPKLFTNTTLYTGNYIYQLNFEGNKWESGVGSFSLKSDFTHYANPKFRAKFGLEMQLYFFIPGQISTTDDLAILPKIDLNYSRKTLLYYQADYDINERWQLSAGLRIPSWENIGPTTYFEFNEEHEVVDTITRDARLYHTYIKVDPRINLKYNLDTSSYLNFSLGSYHQYLQLISNSSSPFTSLEVWLPSSPNIQPQSAQQAALSYLKYFSKPKIEFSAALYHKWLHNQIDYEPQANTLINPLIEGVLRFGKMRTYGLELLLKKDFGKLSGWMSYTYSRAIRKTPEINNGNEYPAFQDRPHDFSLLLNYQLARRTLFSAYWTSYSGSTFSSPTGFYTFNDRRIPIYDEKHNDRFPNYRRLDIAFKFILNKKETARYQHNLTFSIYNLLFHKNIYAINFNKEPLEGSRPVIKANLLSEEAVNASQSDLIRFLPSLSYKFKF